MTDKEKYLEELLRKSFSDEKGECECPFNGESKYDDLDCGDCKIRNLCIEAEKIIKKSTAI